MSWVDGIGTGGKRIRAAAMALVAAVAVSSRAAAVAPSIAWTRTYNGPASTDDYIYDAAVDPSGNLLLAGATAVGGQGTNLTVQVWSPAGALLRTITYNSPANSDEAAYGVASDAAGDIIVAGYEDRPDLGESYNWLVRKYNSAGTLLWSRTHAAPGNTYDQALEMTADAAGNVFVTGYESYLLNNYRWLTQKYDAAGNVIWSRTYKGPSVFNDEAVAIALDGSGNVLVAGGEAITTPPEGVNWRVHKYDGNGNLLWSRSYNTHSGALSNDSPWSLVADSAGNIYVAGWGDWEVDLQGLNWVVRKYDASGALLWSRSYPTPGYEDDAARKIDLSPSGDLVAGGYEYIVGQGNNWRISGYNPADGSVRWTLTWNGAANDDDQVYAIAAAPDGSVYAAGWQYVTGQARNWLAWKLALPVTAVTAVKTQTGGEGIGSPIQYQIAVTNTGGETVTSLVIVDTVSPLVVNVVASSPPGWPAAVVTGVAGSGTRYAWSATGISFRPGTTTVFTISGNIGVVCAPAALSNTAFVAATGPANSATAFTNVVGRVIQPAVLGISVVKTQNPASPTTGQWVTYQIVVTNTGSATITNLVVVDTLPGVVSPVTQTTPGGFTPLPVVQTASGSVYSWINSVGFFPGTSATFQLDGPVGIICLWTTVSNTAYVIATTACTTTKMISNATSFTLTGPTMSFSAVKTQTGGNGIGAPVQYQIVVTNTGATTITNLTLVDTVSPLVVNVVPASPLGWALPAVTSVAGSGTRFVWSASGLSFSPGTTTVFTIDGNIGVVCASKAVSNTAFVIASISCAEVNGFSNGVGSVVQRAPFGLSMVKTQTPVSGSTMHPGSPITYQIVVTNTGSETITSIVVTDTLPGLISVLSQPSPAGFTAQPRAYTASGTIYSWINTGPFAPGAVATFQLGGAEGGTCATTVVSNTAFVTANAACSATSVVSNETNFAMTPPTTSFDVFKTQTPASPPPGSTVTYRIVVTNNAPDDLAPIEIVDTLSPVICNVTYDQPGPPSAPVVTSVASGTRYVWTPLIIVNPGASLTMTVTGTVGTVSVPTAVGNTVFVVGGTTCSRAASTASSGGFVVPPSGPPSAPATLTALGSLAQVALNWAPATAGTNPITAYEIFRATCATCGFSPLATVGYWATASIDAGPMTFGQTYWYEVRARDEIGITGGFSPLAWANAPGYRIDAPAVAVSGVPFWITVTAVDGAANTWTDYCGTSSFTSTDDPLALVNGVAMDAYNYTWHSSLTCPSAPNPNGTWGFLVTFFKPGFSCVFIQDTVFPAASGFFCVVVGTPPAPPVLSVSAVKTLEPVFPWSGGPVTYGIVVANTGAATITDLTVVDTIPPEVTGISWDQPGGFGPPVITSVAPSGTLCVWSKAGLNMLPGSAFTFTITGTVGTVAVPTAVSNTAFVIAVSAMSTTVLATNEAGFIVSPAAPCPPALDMWEDAPVPLNAKAGDIVEYRIGFSNTSDCTGFSVVITTQDGSFSNRAKAAPQYVWVDGGFGAITPLWAKDLGGPWNTTPGAGETEPLYLRWIVQRVGMHKTGFIRYQATVLPGPCQILPAYASATLTSGFPAFIPYVVPYTATATGNQLCDPPGAPATLTASERGYAVYLNWAPAVPGANALSSYEIFRATCPACPSVLIAELPSSQTDYYDQDGAGTDRLYYQVRAKDDAGITGSPGAVDVALIRVTILKFQSPAFPVVGGPVEYRIVVANAGGVTVNNVWLTDSLSSQIASVTTFQPASFGAPLVTSIPSGSRYDWTGGGLGLRPGATFTITVTGIVGDPAVPVTVTNTGRVTVSDNCCSYPIYTALSNTTAFTLTPVGAIPPAAPATLTAIGGPGQIALNWSPAAAGSSPVTAYEIFRSTCGTCGFTALATFGYWSTGYVNTGLAEGSTFWYEVRARDADGYTGAFSSPAYATVPTVTPPAAPVINYAFARTDTPGPSTRVDIVWSNATPGTWPVSAYEVYRATVVGGTTVFIGTAYEHVYSMMQCAITDYSAIADQTYNYLIRAVDTTGLTGPFLAVPVSVLPVVTLTKSVSPVSPVPGGPVTYRIVVENTGSSTIASMEIWDTPPVGVNDTATVQPPVFSDLQVINTGTATTFKWSTVGSIPPFAVYTLTITGTLDASATGTLCNFAYLNVGGSSFPTILNESGYSNNVCFTATGGGSAIPPSAPLTLTAIGGPGQIALNWSTAPPGSSPITAYEIFRATCGTCGFSSLASVGYWSTTWTDVGLPAAATFWYQVRARDAAGITGPFSPVGFALVPSAGTAQLICSFSLVSIPSGTPIVHGLLEVTNPGTAAAVGVIPLLLVGSSTVTVAGACGPMPANSTTSFYISDGPYVDGLTPKAVPVGGITIPAGCTTIFMWNVKNDPFNPALFDLASPLVFNAMLAGTDAGSGATIMCCSQLSENISHTHVPCTITATPSPAQTGQDITVVLHVTNTDTGDIAWWSPMIWVTAGDTLVSPVSSPTPVSTFPAGASRDFSWVYHANLTGTVSFLAGIYGGLGGTGTFVSASSDVSVAILAAPPGAPASLSGVSGAGTVLLTWSAAAAGTAPLTAYEVYRATCATCGFSLLAGVGAGTKSWLDAGIPLGTTCWYEVRARDTAGLTGPFGPVVMAARLPGQVTVTITISPSPVQAGRSFQVVTRITNTGDTGVQAAQPVLSITSGAPYINPPVPPAAVTPPVLSPGGSCAWTWGYGAIAEGNVTFAATADATVTATGAALAASAVATLRIDPIALPSVCITGGTGGCVCPWAGERLIIVFYCRNPGTCQTSVYSLNGTRIWMNSTVVRSRTIARVTWDCRDHSGTFVPPGMYATVVHTPDGRRILRFSVIPRRRR